MDILAARKKAAEREQGRQAAMEEPSAPALPAADPVAVEHSPDGGDAPPAPVELKSDASAVPFDATDDEREAEHAGKRETQQELTIHELEMLSFQLGGEEYVVPVERVREVQKMKELTSVPNAPRYILGICSLRGTMLPVIDLHHRLGFGERAHSEKSRILVVMIDDELLGLRVDRVSGVVRIPEDALRAVPETVQQGVEFLKGIARKDEKLYIFLDLNKVAAD